MKNYLHRFLDLLPKNREAIGIIQSAQHPYYKILLSDQSGLVMCSSGQAYQLGDRVVIQGDEIKRLAVGEKVIYIDI